MGIERIRVLRVPLTLRAPLVTAQGIHASRTATLVEMTLEDGVVGWGENVAPEGTFYTGEDADASHRVMCDVLVPRLVQLGDIAAGDLDRAWGITGWNMAKHALSSAVWDAQSRVSGTSLAEALGGGARPVRVGAVVGLHEEVNDTVEECLARVAEGYTRIKMKIGPGRDLEMVRAVRDVLGSSVDLHVDGNGAYGESDIARLAEVCDLGVALIEQPFAPTDLASHATLATATDALVCLDESVQSRDDLMRAIEVGACGSCNMKPSRVGGFATATEMLSVCMDHGIPAWVGGMLESGVGRAGALALATHPACTLTPDLSATARYFVSDVTEPFVLRDGCLEVPAGPGLGLSPLPGVLESGHTTVETLFER